MGQRVKLLPICHISWFKSWVLSASYSASCSLCGKATEDDLSAWVPASHCETWMEFFASGLSLPLAWHLGAFERVN